MGANGTGGTIRRRSNSWASHDGRCAPRLGVFHSYHPQSPNLQEHICHHDSNTNRPFPDTTLHNPLINPTISRRCTCHESPSASAMSDTSEPRPPAANAHIPTLSHVEDTSGHELPFVQPKTYLRPEPRAMESKPLTPLDREQMHGLVSRPHCTGLPRYNPTPESNV
jgi:hypothetical protein